MCLFPWLHSHHFHTYHIPMSPQPAFNTTASHTVNNVHHYTWWLYIIKKRDQISKKDVLFLYVGYALSAPASIPIGHMYINVLLYKPAFIELWIRNCVGTAKSAGREQIILQTVLLVCMCGDPDRSCRNTGKRRVGPQDGLQATLAAPTRD